MKIHKSITVDRIMAAVEDAMTSLENPGFCTACGQDAYGCEPDAREYVCEFCEAPAVYGAEELMMMTC